MRCGYGMRRPLSGWIHTGPPGLDCLEITAEHYFDAAAAELKQLAARFELYVHGLGLSLGTPGPLDQKTLLNFKRVADHSAAKWISEHIAFTRAGGIDLGHLNPLPLTEDSLATMTRHAIELKEVCQRPLLLENITSQLRLPGELSETDYLNRLCAEAGCGLLLDVTNLWINAQNHGYSAEGWLRELAPAGIVQLHIIGYGQQDGRYVDSHSAAIQPELLELLQQVCEYAPVEAVIIEWDGPNPGEAVLAAELAKVRQAAGLK